MHLKSSWAVIARGAILMAIAVCAAGQSLSSGRSIADDSEQKPPGPRRPHARRTPAPVALPPDLVIPRYVPGVAPFQSGETLVYEASWEGFAVAEARVALTRNHSEPSRWTGQMWITTSPAADLLYRMRDYFREDFDYTTWRPQSLYILQHEKSRLDTWRATFDDRAHLVTATKTNRAGRAWIRRFTGGEPWGPFSGAMMALSQPLTPGKSYTVDVFSGGNRYVFAFAVLQREPLTTGLGTFSALRIEPSAVWLSENSFRDQAASMTVWVTDDKRHLPLRIESAVFFGVVRADLTQIVEPRSAPGAKPIAVSGAATR
jgi:hypothetical protein